MDSGVKNKEKNVVEKETIPAEKDTTGKYLPMSDINRSRSIFQQDGEEYTDEEIMLIYSFLKEMAELSVAAYFKSLTNEESSFNVKS